MYDYRSSGVDLDFAEKIPEIINSIMGKKRENIGGFCAVMKFLDRYIALTTDGVGTKMNIAKLLGRYDTIGIDLVAMNVNDIICSGLKPVYFLDYIGFGKMGMKVFTDLMRGMLKGCKTAGVHLVGGETAQMEIIYKDNYDLVGFAMGSGEKTELFNKMSVKKGDLLIGLPSSGLHSNGYSLINHLIEKKKLQLTNDLLTPTMIYVKKLNSLRKKMKIKNAAHITGGGLISNISRSVPKDLNVKLYYDWKIPEIFKRVQACGISKEEMYNVFNMGIGFVLIVSKRQYIPKNLKVIGEIV